MAHYFKYIPDFEYVSRLPNAKINDYITIKNFFRRGKIFEEIFNDLVFFQKYSIRGDERPYMVANQIYSDPTLDWVIFLSNNIINVQNEWPLPQNEFDSIMLKKYGSYENLYSGIHHYETALVTDSRNRIFIEEGKRISPTWKTNGNYIETINSKIESLNIINPDTNEVEVTTVNDISFLQIGDEIVIHNIGEPEFNGAFVVTNMQSSNVFRYRLNTTPINGNPVLSDPRKEEIRFLIGENSAITSGNAYYYEYYDGGFGYTISVPSTDFINPVTNYQYEINKEEKKRNIFLLKPQYFNTLLQNLEGVMTYKEGGTQFINRKLKRGDNTKIFNH